MQFSGGQESLLALSAAGCGRQGTSGMHPQGFHYLIFILMVKRILLLALISSRTAVGFVGIRSGSYVVGRSGERGHPAPAGQQHFVSLSLRGSIGLGHRRWVCYPGSEGEQVILILWASTVQSWVIISQVGIKTRKS